MQPEYTLVFTLGALLICVPVVRGMLERIGVPALVGYIVLGCLLSIFNQQLSFFSVEFESTIATLAQLGVVAMLFRVGLKSHTSALLEKLPDASFIWIGDVLTNVAFGFLISRYVLALSLETSLVIATAFSATSVAVSVSVWDGMHKLNTSIGQMLVDVAELDDLSGVLLLALLLAIIPVLGDNNAVLLSSIGSTSILVLAKLMIFIVGCYLFSQYLESGFTRFSKSWADSRTGLTISILGAGLGIAAVAGQLGFSLAIGALFAGLAFSRDPEAVHTETSFSYFHDFLAPFFFIHIGMQMEPAAIVPSIGMAVILFVAAVLGKIIGVAVPAMRIVNKRDAIVLGISMIPRAEIAMIVIYQCSIVGGSIVSGGVFSAMVLMSIMTSVIAPIVLRAMLAR